MTHRVETTLWQRSKINLCRRGPPYFSLNFNCYGTSTTTYEDEDDSIEISNENFIEISTNEGFKVSYEIREGSGLEVTNGDRWKFIHEQNKKDQIKIIQRNLMSILCSEKLRIDTLRIESDHITEEDDCDEMIQHLYGGDYDEEDEDEEEKEDKDKDEEEKDEKDKDKEANDEEEKDDEDYDEEDKDEEEKEDKDKDKEEKDEKDKDKEANDEEEKDDEDYDEEDKDEEEKEDKDKDEEEKEDKDKDKEEKDEKDKDEEEKEDKDKDEEDYDDEGWDDNIGMRALQKTLKHLPNKLKVRNLEYCVQELDDVFIETLEKIDPEHLKFLQLRIYRYYICVIDWEYLYNLEQWKRLKTLKIYYPLPAVPDIVNSYTHFENAYLEIADFFLLDGEISKHDVVMQIKEKLLQNPTLKQFKMCTYSDMHDSDFEDINDTLQQYNTNNAPYPCWASIPYPDSDKKLELLVKKKMIWFKGPCYVEEEDSDEDDNEDEEETEDEEEPNFNRDNQQFQQFFNALFLEN
ncbi:hypothetical protein CRE_22928 [Caenorhabditis remanei]|uniref:DUF38 domain-containing protein n=1 Tax=Caenorhabditis remanei TaxID=31234 RepID=E3MW59_CAERE|nr:hypothetical protein CRE_22928 [Caenorhabditis remanei]